jgi:hypothetical protein
MSHNNLIAMTSLFALAVAGIVVLGFAIWRATAGNERCRKDGHP